MHSLDTCTVKRCPECTWSRSHRKLQKEFVIGDGLPSWIEAHYAPFRLSCMACAFAEQANPWGEGKIDTYAAMTRQKMEKHQKSKQHKASVAALCSEMDAKSADTPLPTLREYELLLAHVKKNPIGPYTHHFDVSHYVGLLPHPPSNGGHPNPIQWTSKCNGHPANLQ